MAACPVGEVDGGSFGVLLETDAAIPDGHHVPGKPRHEQVEQIGPMHPKVVDRLPVRRGRQDGRHHRAVGVAEGAVRPPAPPPLHSATNAKAA